MTVFLQKRSEKNDRGGFAGPAHREIAYTDDGAGEFGHTEELPVIEMVPQGDGGSIWTGEEAKRGGNSDGRACRPFTLPDSLQHLLQRSQSCLP
jgi:hypothetical protein